MVAVIDRKIWDGNFIHECKPHKFQRLTLANRNRKDVGTVSPSPVLDGIGVSGVSVGRFVCANAKSVPRVDNKTGQETVGSTHGLKGFKVLGVDEGGEVTRLKRKRGGVDVLTLTFSEWPVSKGEQRRDGVGG